MPTLDRTAYVAPNGATYRLKSAAPSEAMLKRRLRSGIYCIEDGDLMKRCSKCKDHWPADSEFFFVSKDDDGLSQWCKACYKAWRHQSQPGSAAHTAEASE